MAFVRPKEKAPILNCKDVKERREDTGSESAALLQVGNITRSPGGWPHLNTLEATGAQRRNLV